MVVSRFASSRTKSSHAIQAQGLKYVISSSYVCVTEPKIQASVVSLTVLLKAGKKIRLAAWLACPLSVVS
jgi:hypothetical protein